MTDSLSQFGKADIRHELNADAEFSFSPVDFLGDKRLSHTVILRGSKFHLKDADGNLIGHYRTFAAADPAGLAASAENIP